MTMPHLMNCAHMDDGHCLDCVKAEWERRELEASLPCSGCGCSTSTSVAARISAAVAEEREAILKLLTESAFDLMECPGGARCDHASALDCAAAAIRARGSQKGEP